MQQILFLLILLLVARLFGAAADRMGQSATMGEVLAGVVVGLVFAWSGGLLPPLGVLSDGWLLPRAADLGIFLVILYAGVEMRPREIIAHPGTALAVALGGVLLPFSGGFALGWIFLPESEFRTLQALVIGTGLSVSAIPVTAKLFLEFDILHSRAGNIVITAAVFDDVLALILLAVVTHIIIVGHVPTLPEISLLVGEVTLFFVITIAVGLVMTHIMFARFDVMRDFGVALMTLLAIAGGFAVLAELLEMHFILGPFMAGLFFAPSMVGTDTYQRLNAALRMLSNRLFGPVFFAFIGLHVDLGAAVAIPGFLALLLIAAVMGKLVGAGVPALCAGIGLRESYLVGAGMNARGAIELIVARIALENGLFAVPGAPDGLVPYLFSALVFVAIATTLATPLLLRLALGPPRHGIAADTEP